MSSPSSPNPLEALPPEAAPEREHARGRGEHEGPPAPGEAIGRAPSPGEAGLPGRPSIGEVLLASGRIDQAALERARRVQSRTGERLDALLLQLGYIGERDLAEALARTTGLPLATEKDLRAAPALLEQVSGEFLARARVLPLGEENGAVRVAMADPLDDFAAEAMRLALGRPVERMVGVPSEIEQARRRLYSGEGGAASPAFEGLVETVSEEDPTQSDVEQLRDQASEAPVIRVVNLIIADALNARASDIHIEPFESELRVRYRVDGVLRAVEAPPVQSAAAVISRIKVMAHLNIAERRLPQDGRIRIRIEGRELDLRVSTVPTLYGESVVLRILDRSAVPLDFRVLGFRGAALERFLEVLERPHGIVLVTGPTGSGKTTTLYAALTHLNTPERKILTVEDPVEYQLDGINQIPVKPRIGLGFAEALRSILRQDPDVIMVGEMRDVETARIAVQAALTGHQVFSTLHTNDAPASITRLLDMGVEDFLLTSTVNAVLAQRLVRTLCPECRTPYAPPPALVEELGLEQIAAEQPEVVGEQGELRLWRSPGCERCRGLGYRGRTGILELLVMSDPVREAILARAGSHRLRGVATAHGFRTMFQDGLAKALAGETTPEEVVRVIQED